MTSERRAGKVPLALGKRAAKAIACWMSHSGLPFSLLYSALTGMTFETGATPAGSDEGGHRDGEQGGSEDLEGAAETGIGRGAGDVLGEERAHGDPGRQADAAEDLRDDEGGQGAPLDVVDGVLPHPREYAASSGVCRTVA